MHERTLEGPGSCCYLKLVKVFFISQAHIKTCCPVITYHFPKRNGEDLRAPIRIDVRTLDKERTALALDKDWLSIPRLPGEQQVDRPLLACLPEIILANRNIPS